MDATVAATITGVLLSVSFAAYAMSFARLRSDMHAGFDRLDTHSTGWTPVSTGWTPGSMNSPQHSGAARH